MKKFEKGECVIVTTHFRLNEIYSEGNKYKYYGIITETKFGNDGTYVVLDFGSGKQFVTDERFIHRLQKRDKKDFAIAKLIFAAKNS